MRGQTGQRGLWTLGASEEVRLAERERLFVWVRWIVAAFATVAVVSDAGRDARMAAAIPALLLVTNVLAAFVGPRLEGAGVLRRLGIAVTLADGGVAILAVFNYAHHPDTGTGLLLMLVVLEASVRWGSVGGLAAGVAAGAVTLAWMLHRDTTFAIEFRASTAGARAGAYVLAGLLLGAVIQALDRAAVEIRRIVRRTDAVGRFAIEAPRMSVDDAARQLASVLHDDLGLDRVAIVIVDDERPDRFRLVATAGYEHVDLDQYRDLSTSTGIVGRCLRAAEPQLLRDVATDADYLEVDPATRSEMAVPLRSGDAVFGVIDVASRTPDAFGEDDLAFLESVGGQLGRAFDNARVGAMERQTIEELERLSAMKDDFIAIANHELRTPVTSIAGFAQSLMRQREVLTPAEVEDAIERIARQSAHLKRLLEDLLTMPREGAGTARSQVRAVCLREIASEVIEGFADDTLHPFSLHVPEDLPAVAADADGLRRVLSNLVSNAIKYSPGGGEVQVRALDEGTEVRVEVCDEGVGIDPSEAPRLFTKFGRVDVGTGGHSGMGLGLFIVKELVTEMGGTVGVDSIPGQGSVFWFRLQVADGLVEATDSGAPRPS